LDVIPNDEGRELIRIDAISADGAIMTALDTEEQEARLTRSVRGSMASRLARSARGAPGGSTIYGSGHVTVAVTQGGSLVRSATMAFAVASPMASPLALSPDVANAFAQMNADLISSDVMILPGNDQDPMTDGNIVTQLSDVDIEVIPPDGARLPECFEPDGDRGAANIDIDISDEAPAGTHGLVPMTYRVTLRSADLNDLFGAEVADEILIDPLDYLDTIFSKYVIQKGIRQGEREGWYTRLVDGILKPREAVDLGILEVTSNGMSVTLSLSFYIADDPTLESFVVRDGYLIAPDGDGDGRIVDPIWLNRWRDGYAPGANSLAGRGGSGGGGCETGSMAFVLSLLALPGLWHFVRLIAARRKMSR
ncbi:MAG: hypothetical protein LBS93_04595, partial [Synergistaceae bacterium]|nr:hypothetical protein [Synergistaceae bacterium]